MNDAKHSDRIWSIVLAGGEGARMRAWIQASFGVSDPKQFCFLHGNRSMFQSTLDRARQIASDGKILAVTVRNFEEISRMQIEGRRVDLLVLPANRGTTCAIYFALSYIMARDPNARVAVFPSDHYVEPETTFVTSIRSAFELSALIPDKLLLIGATPDRMESDYGYLLPGATIASYGGNRLSSVSAFREKPCTEEITSILQAGGLWSTFITIGKAHTFFKIGATCVPEIVNEFHQYQSTIESCNESVARAALCESIEQSDFSNDVLQNVPDHLAVYQLNNLHWSDWGRPERVRMNRVRKDSSSKQSQP